MGMYHFGDPCIHCGTPHDEIEPGAYKGDPKKAKPIAYRSTGVRLDGVEGYLIRFSDGRMEERHSHVSNHAPYYHFGHSEDLITPPAYDQTLSLLAGETEQ